MPASLHVAFDAWMCRRSALGFYEWIVMMAGLSFLMVIVKRILLSTFQPTKRNRVAGSL
jgi:hypothetical protein